MARSQFYGWKLLAAFWLILVVNLGFPAYGWSVINAYMVADLQLNRTLAGWPYSLYMIMSGLPGPLVALCVLKIGVRWTVVLGSLLVMIGSAVMALLVDSGIEATIAFGLIVGLGVACGGVLGTQAGVVQWFVRRRALALSLLYSGGSIGGFLAAPLLNNVITSAGGDWRAGCWLLAALAVLSTLVAVFFIKERPADLGQEPDGGAPPAGEVGSAQSTRPSFITAEVWTAREVAQSPAFWIMVLALCGGSAGLTLFLAHGVLHLMDLGHSAAIAARSVSVMTASTLLGKVALGALGDRIDPRYIWVATMISFGIGLILVVNATGMASLYAFAICIGFGFGGGLVCMMAVLSNYYGLKAFATAAGLAAAINTTASFFAPIVGGRLYDELGSYAPTFYSLAAWCFVGAVALLIVRQPTRPVALPAAVIDPHAAARDTQASGAPHH